MNKLRGTLCLAAAPVTNPANFATTSSLPLAFDAEDRDVQRPEHTVLDHG